MNNRKEVAERLWDRMTHIYGKQWESNYGHIGGNAFKSWANAMDEFSPQQIKRGLDALVAEGSDFVPNLIKFCRLCRTAPVSYHQPVEKALPRPKGSYKSFRLTSALCAAIFGSKPTPPKRSTKFKNDWTDQDEQELQDLFKTHRGERLTKAIEELAVSQ